MIALETRMTSIGSGITADAPCDQAWFRQGRIPSGQDMSFEYVCREPERVVMAAIGDRPGVSLDLSIRDMRKERIEARDASPDRRSAVEWICAPDSHYTVELSSTGAGGKFRVQAFSKPVSAALTPLAGLFDRDPAGRRSWDHVASRMRASAYKPVREPVRIRAGRKDHFSFSHRLRAGNCYAFAAQGSAGIDRLGLRLKRGSRLLAADLSARPEVWAKHCAEQDEEIRIIIDVHGGSGSVIHGGFAAPRAAVVKEVGPPIAPNDPVADLEEAAAGISRALERRGFSPGRTLLDGEVSPGVRRWATASLRAGECAMVTAASAPGMSDLDMEIYDERESLVGADRRAGTTPMVGLCASQDQTYRIEIIGLTGNGLIRILINRLPVAAWPGIDDRAAAFGAAEASARFARAGLLPSFGFAPMTAQADGTWTGVARIHTSACWGIAAIGTRPVDRVRIDSPSGEPIARWSGPGNPALLTACDTKPGPHRVEVAIKGTEKERTAGTAVFLSVFVSSPPGAAADGSP